MLLTADSAVVYSGMALTVGEMEDFCQIDDSTGTVRIDPHPTGITQPLKCLSSERESCRLMATKHQHPSNRNC